MGRSVVVIDEDYRQEGQNSKSNATKIETQLLILINTIENVNVEGIASGMAAENLRVLIGTIKGIKGEFEYVGTEEQRLVEQFIQEVDVADSFLYEG